MTYLRHKGTENSTKVNVSCGTKEKRNNMEIVHCVALDHLLVLEQKKNNNKTKEKMKRKLC